MIVWLLENKINKVHKIEYKKCGIKHKVLSIVEILKEQILASLKPALSRTSAF